MKYEIKIPAILGDAIPLYFVADAMAGAASTAFGTTPRHKPIYDCDLRTHIKHLLDQAHSGKLVVCNRAGNIDTTANIIAVAKKTGNYYEKSRLVREPDWAELKRLHPPAKEDVLDLSRIDLGPSITNWDVTNIDCLYSKLSCLNEWGKTRGDEFLIAAESAAWVDDRGYMKPETTLPVASTASAPKEQAIPGKIPKTTNCKLAIKAAWQIECETHKRATAKQVIEKLQSWIDHKDNPNAVTALIKKIPNGVMWVTTAGKENDYDIGACSKTLENWNKTRT